LASAGENALAQEPFSTSQYNFAGTDTIAASTGSDDPDGQTQAQAAQAQDAQAPPDVAPSSEDRRDRIYYPGDTERPKPLLKKLFLNIAYDQKDIFH
jgi:hypothetical protein